MLQTRVCLVLVSRAPCLACHPHKLMQRLRFSVLTLGPAPAYLTVSQPAVRTDDWQRVRDAEPATQETPDSQVRGGGNGVGTGVGG